VSVMFRIQYLSTQYQCPDCSGPDAYRSRRRTFLEKYVLPVLLLKPARCADCFHRSSVPMFMKLRDRADKPDVKRPAAA
jgi:hypothetical protein